MRKVALLSIFLLLSNRICQAQCALTIARLKYGGGGDWYANPSSLPNLILALKQRTKFSICDTVATVNINDNNFFHFPFIYMTGHGDVHFTGQERIRLRTYLIGGGFLWADDCYGMDQSFRQEVQALFPESPLVKLDQSHPIYNSFYKLPGLPKIHEHDGKPAEGLAVMFENRVVIYYTYSSDIGDGMEDISVHNDGEILHELAIKMGINIVSWFLNP